jgi:hypothetical protein
MRRTLLLAVIAALMLALAPTARAGTYEVKACRADGIVYPNNSWTFSVPSANWATVTNCPAPSNDLTLLMLGNTSTPASTKASLTFTPPSGARVRDFFLTRWVYYYNPTIDGSGTAPPYILYSFGNTAFAGAGEYDAATRDAINATGHWYGYPSGALDTGAAEVTKATFGRLTGLGDADSLTIEVGCWATPCSVRSDGNVFTTLYGARVVVADGSRPTSARALTSAGLLTKGSHGGDEGARFSATDNVGIRVAELLDMTGGGNPRVVGRRVLSCDYSRPRPCGNVNGGTVTPSSRLPSGTRKLAIRVTDAAGNRVTSAAVSTFVGGPANGLNAGAGGRLRAVFTRGGKTRRTVRAAGRPSVTVSARNAAGLPIGGARIQVRAKQRRPGARYRAAGELTTGPDGVGRYVVRKGPSRDLRFEYRSRVDNPSPSMATRARLSVRPKASLAVRPRRVRFGGRIRLSGRVISRPRPRAGKLVVLQAFDGGRWRPLATVRSRKRGRFSATYRFRRTSRPRTFRFRARLPREGAYPYASGKSRTVRVRVG